MPARRIVLLGVVLLVAVLGTAVWVLPAVLDWNRYRDAIAGLAAERLGRPVHIGGAVTLQLLPQPILQAADVSIDDAGDGLGLHARALRLRVALPSLLAGTIDTRELTVQGADLRLPWPPPPALVQRPQAWFTGLRARVEDSRLQVGGLVLSGIGATLTTDPDTGTLSVAGVGEAGVDGTGPRRWQFTARLAQPGRDGAAGLDISLDGQGPLKDTGGTFSGQVAADGALTGRVAGRGPDLSALLPAPALPWRGDGRLNAAGGLAVADELALEVGGTPARGAVALRVLPDARLDLAVAAGRLDLDAWLPALLAGAAVPRSIPTGLDISAEAATLAGGTLRRLRAAVDLNVAAPGTDGTTTLRDVSVLLPGEASLALSGRLGSGAAAQFDGTVRLAAPDLPATLRWVQPLLAPAFPGLPAPSSALPRTAELNGRVMADAAVIAVSDLRGTVDGGAITGTATIRRGARTGVSVDLVLARLAFDPWLPDPAVPLPAPVAGMLARLRAVDADIRLRAETADWAGVPLGAVALEVNTEAARVVLRRLEAAPLGARLSASGQVGENGRITDGRLELAAPDLAALRPLFARLPRLPAMAQRLLRGPGNLVATAAGPPEALAGRITAELDDLRLDLQPVVNIPARRVTGAVTLHHPGAPRLLETLGLGTTAAWLGDGSFSLVGQVAGSPGRLELLGGTLAAGALRMSGQLVQEGRRVTGHLVAETLPLPLVYPRSPDPLPFGLLRGWSASVRLEAAAVLAGLVPVLDHASAQWDLQDGVLKLGQVSGQALGGSVSGTAVVDTAADPPRVTVSGKAAGLGITGAVFGTPVDVVAGLADADANLSGAGYSPAALLATVSGTVAVAVRDGTATGFDLPAAAAALSLPTAPEVLAAVRVAVSSGSTRLGRLDAALTVARGLVGVDATLVEPGGNGRLGGSLDLGTNTLDARLLLHPAPPAGAADGPELGVRLAGAAGAVMATPELAGLARWLAERPVAP